MATVYKKFTAQDKALVPFNAHKQYTFDSGSSATNKIKFFSSKWTSESISQYSSASTNILGAFDPINRIKYHQIDHLYYKNFLTDSANRFENYNYLKHKRNLYQNVNILSIPTGLYGSEIKPGSFYLSSSAYQITDDFRIGEGAFGNLIISGTNITDYPLDVRENVFRLDPIDGFEKYDLSIYPDYALKFSNPQHPEEGVYKVFYKQGLERTNSPQTYTTIRTLSSSISDIPEKDDSYFLNNFSYNNVKFVSSSLGSVQGKFSQIKFDSTTGSFVVSEHKEIFNFDKDDDFAISFWIEPDGISSFQHFDNKKRHIISKSTTKTIIPEAMQGRSEVLSTNVSGNMQPKDIPAEPRFPFEIYMKSSSLYFDRSDGNQTISINGTLTGSGGDTTGSFHVLCQKTESVMEMYFDGNLITSSTDNLEGNTRNLANLYIGTKGHLSEIDEIGGIGTSTIGGGFIIEDYLGNNNTTPFRYFSGKLSNINIWEKSFPLTTIKNISESVNASPYIGNIFYKTGFATITHPKYQDILYTYGVGNLQIGGGFNVGMSTTNGINKLKFQGTHKIYEQEYQCTVDEHEFNYTYNISARKKRSSSDDKLADFVTGSLFKPYVTTIGLYNEKGDLLVVGKLGQPIRMSNETDTTFVLRWDT